MAISIRPEDIAEVDRLVSELAGRARVPFSEVAFLPKMSGLYAIWAETDTAQRLLGLSDYGRTLPIYVGLAKQPLPGRVGQYVEPTYDVYVPARRWVERALRDASHVMIPEESLLEAPLALDPPLAMEHGYLDGLVEWMKRHLSVSVVTLDGVRAQRLEHAVIARLEPSANRQGMAWALDIDGFYERRYTPRMRTRRLAWGRALWGCYELSRVLAGLSRRDTIALCEREMFFDCDEDGMPTSVSFAPTKTTGVQLNGVLPLHPDVRAEACAEAMDAWWGAPYPDVERLLDALEDEDWIPGVMWRLVQASGDPELGRPLEPLEMLAG